MSLEGVVRAIQSMEGVPVPGVARWPISIGEETEMCLHRFIGPDGLRILSVGIYSGSGGIVTVVRNDGQREGVVSYPVGNQTPDSFSKEVRLGNSEVVSNSMLEDIQDEILERDRRFSFRVPAIFQLPDAYDFQIQKNKY